MVIDDVPRPAGRFRERYGPWAVVTGASDGIGRALAVETARRGVHVVLVARREPALEEVAREVTDAFGVRTSVVATDLTGPAAVAGLVDRLDGLDVGLVVAAAGFGSFEPFAEGALTTELQQLQLNVGSVVELVHRMTPGLVARRSGGIVLLSSLLAFQGVPGSATYAASKAYVQVLAEGLAPELAAAGVDVLSSAPGPVHSGFAARAGYHVRSADNPDVVARRTLDALGRRTTVRPGPRSARLGYGLGAAPRGLRTAILGRRVDQMVRELRTPSPSPS
jgi:short-subunit dehydrogenase